MIVQDALAQIESAGNSERAASAKAYHKSPRHHFGTPNPVLNTLTKTWRQSLSLDARVTLASELWDSDIFEARVAAAKLLTQARIIPDAAVWDLIASWVPQFDGWAIADHACMAGQRRLTALPQRLDVVEAWTRSDHMWSRRAALVMTLPWAKKNHPKPAELETTDRVLGWMSGYVSDPDWFIQKSVAWWLRDLSKHDAPRAHAFLDSYGPHMKRFAIKEAQRYLKDEP